MEKILLFGNGQIAHFYEGFLKKEGIDCYISLADITDKKLIEQAIDLHRPTIVINTAAKTNLEWVSNNKLEAFHVNVLGADNIAQVCDERGIYFIHFSSGCILESKNENDAKRETDSIKPLSYYSWTKVWAEQLIQWEKSKDFKYLILRPRQPVSAQVNYKNMLMKFLTFTRFIETPNNGTVIEDLMKWSLHFFKEKPVGILHVANEGWTTPYEIALLLKKYVLPELDPIKISKEDLNKLTPNKRVDTVLSIEKLKSMGIEVKPYKARLEEIIQELAENIKKTDKNELKIQLDKTLEQSRLRTIVNDVWPRLLG